MDVWWVLRVSCLFGGCFVIVWLIVWSALIGVQCILLFGFGFLDLSYEIVRYVMGDLRGSNHGREKVYNWFIVIVKFHNEVRAVYDPCYRLSSGW